MRNFRWYFIYLYLVFFLLYSPIFYLILHSFDRGENLNNFTSFTWNHYKDLFNDYRLLTIVLNTFILAFSSAFFATLIGTFGAIGIYFLKKRSVRLILMSISNVLLVSPDIIIGASFLILFSFISSIYHGFILGFFSVLLSHIAFSIPIVLLIVSSKIQKMSKSMIDASKDLGANSFQILKEIILPFLSPSIITSYFMAFTYSLDDFAVTFFVTGNGFTTVAVEIYSRARQGISLEVNALSTLIFFFSIFLITGYYLICKNSTLNKSYNKS